MLLLTDHMVNLIPNIKKQVAFLQQLESLKKGDAAEVKRVSSKCNFQYVQESCHQAHSIEIP